jgi:hypothetical protein
MKIIFSLICYAVYFIYGFLFSGLYIGLNALDFAIKDGRHIVLQIAAITIHFIFLSTTLYWLYGKFLKKKSPSDSIVIKGYFICILVVSFLLFFPESKGWRSFLELLATFFIANSPILLCVYLLKDEPRGSGR